jgi:hypothetical protein
MLAGSPPAKREIWFFSIVALPQGCGPAALAAPLLHHSACTPRGWTLRRAGPKRKSGVPYPGLFSFTPTGFSIGVRKRDENVMSKNPSSPRLRRGRPTFANPSSPRLRRTGATAGRHATANLWRDHTGAFYQNWGQGHSSSLPQSNTLVTNDELRE